MILLDANILLYAYDSTAPQHSLTARWLGNLLESNEAVGLPWVTIWAFLRIATNSRILARPLSTAHAFGIVRDWLSQPGVAVLEPGPRHVELLERLVREHQVTGPLMTDAALAAMAIENGAVLASTDEDFRRFPEVRWLNPLV